MFARQQQIAAAIILLTILKNKKKSVKRTCWVRNWIEKRNTHGAFLNLLLELRIQDPHQLFNFIRMTATDFEFLLEKIGNKIKKQDTHFRKSISPAERLIITLRFLASGDSYKSLMYLFRVASCTISKIVPEVCAAIYETLRDEYLKLPATQEDWSKVAETYNNRWNFPHCIGAIDGKHVVMKAPAHSASTYFNYKGTHSIVLMIVADAEYKIIYMNCGCIGRISDAGVFRNTALFSALEKGELRLPPPSPLTAGRQKAVPFVLVADDAFALTNYLMKPFSYKIQHIEKRVFNYRLSRARRMVESIFGILASRFRVLRKPIELSPKKTELITSTICVLHNFLVSRNNSARYLPEFASPTAQPEEEMPTNNFIPLEHRHIGNVPQTSVLIRDEFKDFFVSPDGEVPWQYEKVV